MTAFASPAEAYARIALALSEVRKYLIPDGNDEIRQRQMKEIQIMKQQKQQEGGGSASSGSPPPPQSQTAISASGI